MSSMYPPSISLPGSLAGPSPEGAPAAPDAPASGAAAAVEAVRKAKALVSVAIQNESDHEDVLILEKVTTLLQQYLATNQRLVDGATGASAGTRLIRKVTG